MKKFSTLLSFVLSFVCLCVCLVSCGGNQDDNQEHLPSGLEWVNDENDHWRKCSVENCTEKHRENHLFETAAHVYAGDMRCIVCGYEYPAADWTEETQDNIRYVRESVFDFNSDEIVERVTAYVEDGAVSAQIPAEYRGLPVMTVRIGADTLKELHIPQSVTSVSFDNYHDTCPMLEKITVSENNEVYSAVDGILYNKAQTEMIFMPERVSGTVHIPDGVQEIFGNMGCIEVLYTGDGITDLNLTVASPYENKNIKELHIGKNVENISLEDGDRMPAIGLSVITVDSENEHFSAEGNVLYNKDKTEVLFVSNTLRSVVFPDGVETINLYGGRRLLQVTIPESVQHFNGNYGNSDKSICEIYNLSSVNIEAPYVHTSLNEPSVLEEAQGGYIIVDGTLVDYVGNERNLILPESVRTINNYAFCNNETIESVIIPENVRCWEFAFANCSNLKSVSIAGSVDSYSFAYCSSLSDVTIAETASGISTLAFAYSSAIVEENGVQYVGNWAVYISKDIENLVIREGTVGIAFGNLYLLTNLKSVSLPKSLSVIEDHNIRNLPDEVYEIYNNGRYIGNWYFGMVDTSASELIIKDGTEHIYTDDYGVGLSKLTIPKSIKTMICDYSYRTLSFNGDVYDWWDFQHKSIAEYCDLEINGVAVSEITEFTVKDGVTEIPQKAFYGFNSLEKIVLPEGVLEIGKQAFDRCYRLDEIYLPASITSIGSYAFSGVESENVKIYYAGTEADFFGIEYTDYSEGDAVLPYGELYFGNTLITELNIPDNVENIPWSTLNFKGVTLKVSSDNQYYSVQNGIIYNKDKTEFAYIPDNLSGEIIIPEGITAIPDYAFCDIIGITSVKLPSTLTKVGERAFEGTSIESIVIPEGVTEFASFVFNNCEQLVWVTIPSTIDFDRFSTFWGSPNVKGEVYGNIYYIGKYFEGPVDNNITWARIRPGTTEIPDYAFKNCSNLSRLYVPESVTYIGTEAFFGTSKYFGCYFEATNPDMSIDVGTDVRLWGYDEYGDEIYLDYFSTMPTGLSITENGLAYAHEYAPSTTGIADYTTILYAYFGNATELTIPSVLGGNELYMIYMNAFMNNTTLESVTIQKCTVIGSFAFAGCSKLVTVMLPEGLSQIGTYSFQNCSNLQTANIPENIDIIGAAAFQGCTSLQNATSGTNLYIWQYNEGSCVRLGEITATNNIAKALSDTYSDMYIWFFNNQYTQEEVEATLGSIFG